jgi:hypothetical protein
MEKKAQVIMDKITEKLDAQLKAFQEEASTITAMIGVKAAKAIDTLREQLAKMVDEIAEEVKAAMTGITKTTMKYMVTLC